LLAKSSLEKTAELKVNELVADFTSEEKLPLKEFMDFNQGKSSFEVKSFNLGRKLY